MLFAFRYIEYEKACTWKSNAIHSSDANQCMSNCQYETTRVCIDTVPVRKTSSQAMGPRPSDLDHLLKFHGFKRLDFDPLKHDRVSTESEFVTCALIFAGEGRRQKRSE